MRWLCVWLCVAKVACVTNFNFTILFTGFLQGCIMPIDPKTSLPCNVDKSTSAYGSLCNGGAARRMTWLTQMKQADPNTLVVDLGSSFWGSTFCTCLLSAEHISVSSFSSCFHASGDRIACRSVVWSQIPYWGQPSWQTTCPLPATMSMAFPRAISTADRDSSAPSSHDTQISIPTRPLSVPSTSYSVQSEMFRAFTRFGALRSCTVALFHGNI
jgi:hypothetical protein